MNEQENVVPEVEKSRPEQKLPPTEQTNTPEVEEPNPTTEDASATPPPMEAPTAPPAIPEPAEPSEQDVYWHRVLTGNPDTVPQDVRERAGANDAALDPEQQEYTLFSAVNRSWLADHKGLSREAVMADWRTHRANLAGELGVPEDERELFMALSDREQEAERRKVAQQVYELAYYAGLHGDESYDLQKISLPIAQADRATAETVAEHAFVEGARLRERYMPLAQQLADGLDVFAAAEEDVFSAPRVIAGVPGLAEATDRLSDMPEDERRIVEYLAVRMARQKRQENGEPAPEEEWFGSRAVRAVRRGAGSLGFGALQAINHAGIATLDNLGDLLGGDMGQDIRENAAVWDKRMRVLNDIRHLSQQEATPLYKPDSSRAERFFIEGTQAVPAAVLSCCGGAGLAALSLSGMGESVAEARRRAPEGSKQLQLAAGVLGGAVQGAIYMGMSRIGGRLLEQNIANFMKARGSGLANYTLAGLKSMLGTTAEGVKLMLAGKAAAAADLGVHELAARASDTASNIDWKLFGDNLTDIECNMREAASILPFLLIGAGRAALHHFRAGSNSVLGTGAKLLEWNVPKEKVEAILKEKDTAACNRLLQEAVRESDLMNDKRYSADVMRAMCLLNTDGNPVFKTAEAVRDFLHLPASFRVPENAAEQAPAKSSRKETHEAILLRDEWERLAGLWEGPGDLAVMSSTRGKGVRSLLNGRGTSRGYYYAKDNVFRNRKSIKKGSFYAPSHEAWRRDVLNRHCDELRRLSYRLLLQFYSQDALTSANNGGVKAIAEDATNLRRRYFDMVQKAVMGYAKDKTKETEKEMFDALARECGDMLRDYRGDGGEPPAGSAWWIRNAPEHLVDGIEKYCLELDHKRMLPYPELREFFWLMYRTRACVAALNSLLPYSSDFQTLLSLNHSPAMAYEHLLKRELSVADTPPPLRFTPAPVQQETLDKGNIYKQMTGYEMESSVGDTGETFYRMKQADGTWTSWHNSPEAVMSVLAGNNALLFTPVRTSLEEFLKREFDNPECLRNLPFVEDHTYTGHDQLCGMAMHDLLAYWMESAAHMQPGMYRSRIRYASRSLREGQSKRSLLELTYDGQYWVDSLSTLTPLNFARNRFEVFWLRQLKYGIVAAKNVADFLLKTEILTKKQHDDYLKLQEFPKVLKKRSILYRGKHRFDYSMERMYRRFAKGMSTFTLRYFFSRLMELELPQSVKHWFGLSAFSPVYKRLTKPQVKKKVPAKDGKEPQVKTVIPFINKKKRYHELSWSNHQSISQLHELAPYLEEYRKLYANGIPDPDINRLMPAALSQDKARQIEQAWAHYWGSEGSLGCSSEDLWAIMRYPMDTWNRISPEVRDNYTWMLKSFCEENAPEGLPQKGDVVESAIANLDTVLKICPSLHQYSHMYKKAAPDMLRVLHVNTPDEMQFEGKETIGNYEAVTETRADYTVSMQKIPPFIADSPSVLYALKLLDILRIKTARNPHFNGEYMRWKGRHYGKDDLVPPGLKEWKPRPCMKDLLDVLVDIAYEQGGTDAVTYNAGGVEVPILRVAEVELPIFDLPISFTHDKLLSYTYRMMPGSIDATDLNSRYPYVVGTRSGVPISADAPTEGKAQPYLRTIVSDFVHAPFALDSSLVDSIHDMRETALKDEFEQVCAIAENGADPESTLPQDTTELFELLLELFEDSGFNDRIGFLPYQELSGIKAEAFRLASNMIRCIAVPYLGSPEEATKAYAELKKNCDWLKANPERMEELIMALAYGKKRVSRIRRMSESEFDPGPEIDFENLPMSDGLREFVRENIGVELPENLEWTPETQRIIREWLRDKGILADIYQFYPEGHPNAMTEEEKKQYKRAKEMGIPYIDKNWLNNFNKEANARIAQFEKNKADPEWVKQQEEKKKKRQETIKKNRIEFGNAKNRNWTDRED